MYRNPNLKSAIIQKPGSFFDPPRCLLPARRSTDNPLHRVRSRPCTAPSSCVCIGFHFRPSGILRAKPCPTKISQHHFYGWHSRCSSRHPATAGNDVHRYEVAGTGRHSAAWTKAPAFRFAPSSGTFFSGTFADDTSFGPALERSHIAAIRLV